MTSFWLTFYLDQLLGNSKINNFLESLIQKLAQII